MTLPSHSSEAQARARNPRHNGLTQAIRDLITARGPLTIKEMAAALNQPEHRIRDRIRSTAAQQGGFMRIGKTTPHIFGPYQPPVDQPAGRYVRAFRELHRDPFAAMNLALMVRR